MFSCVGSALSRAARSHPWMAPLATGRRRPGWPAGNGRDVPTCKIRHIFPVMVGAMQKTLGFGSRSPRQRRKVHVPGGEARCRQSREFPSVASGACPLGTGRRPSRPASCAIPARVRGQPVSGERFSRGAGRFPWQGKAQRLRAMGAQVQRLAPEACKRENRDGPAKKRRLAWTATNKWLTSLKSVGSRVPPPFGTVDAGIFPSPACGCIDVDANALGQGLGVVFRPFAWGCRGCSVDFGTGPLT